MADNLLNERKYNGNKFFRDYLKNPLPGDNLEFKGRVRYIWKRGLSI